MAAGTIRYTGRGGEFLQNIPARDLSAQEFEELGADARKAVRESALYDYAGFKEASKPVAAPKKAAPRREATATADAPRAVAAPVDTTPDTPPAEPQG